MDVLQVTEANGKVVHHPLDSESLEIGRSSRLGLTLNDRSLSRRHARIFRDGARWMVEDLGSHNGTFVNRAPIDIPTEIRAGDHIELGSCSLELTSSASRKAPVVGPSVVGHTLFKSATELLQRNSLATREMANQDGNAARILAERLAMLNEVHQALDRSIELDELLELILDRAFDHLKPEEGAIFLRRADESIYCAASRSVRSAFPLESQSLFVEVMQKGQVALVLDAELDQRFQGANSLLDAGVRSLLAAPLMDTGRAVGMIVLGSTINVRQFSEEDMALLTSLASVAALRIRNVRLTDEAAQRRQLEQEVRLARHIQETLLPTSLPAPDGYALKAVNIPSRGVSGDLYKVVERADARECVLLLADVSGKGIAASLLTASLEALSAAPIEDGLAPEVICDRVSRLLYERTPPEKYATAFLAILEHESGVVRYVNAGHNPGIVIRSDGRAEWLRSTGPPLGILPVAAFEAAEVTLGEADTFLVYTDGITEATNPQDEEYGGDRLMAVGQGCCAASLEELAAAIEADVAGHADGVPFADDRTLVLLRRLVS